MAGETTDRVSILMVDDRPSNLLALTGILERPDYELVLADSGEDALVQVLRRDFAVILMDVAMPGMDGFETVAMLKQRERSRLTPIIFVTASVQNIDWVFRGYTAGAVDFLIKPLDPHAVRAKVEVFVELFRQKQQIQRQAEQLRVSERREREHEMTRLKLESERRYRHLAEAIPHVVWTADPEGALDYLSRRWSEVTGSDERDPAPCSQALRAAIHAEDLEAFEARWGEGIRSGAEFEIECRLRQADASYRWYLCHALPERSGAEAAHWLGTLTDIDEQKVAREELRAAIRLRDEFLSVASHELRTPLTALQLQLQSLKRWSDKRGKETFDDRAQSQLGTSLRQTERLSALVDNLLDVSRIAVGRLDLKLEPLDLKEVVEDVVDRLRGEATRNKCELKLRVDAPVPGRWDRLRVEQVMTNLISNAMKYGAEHPVEISLDGDDDAARISVRDEGIGIAAGELDRIFGRFERAVSSRHYGGLGLGLYIVQQIVEAHGGHVRADSAPGRGSTFVVELPRSSAREGDGSLQDSSEAA